MKAATILSIFSLMATINAHPSTTKDMRTDTTIKGKFSHLTEGDIGKLVDFAKSHITANKKSRAEAAPGGLLNRRDDENCIIRPCEEHGDCDWLGCGECDQFIGDQGFCKDP